MSETDSRQTRRTKRLLSDALMDLIVESSYDAITVQEIADRADVGRATFYNHYNDKDQLLAAMITSIQEELAQRLANTPVTPGSLPGLRALLSGAIERPQLIALVLTHGAAFAQIHSMMTESVRSNMAIQLGDEIELNPAPAFVAGAILGAVRWWMAQENRPTIETMERRVGVLVRNGVEGLVRTTSDP